MNNSESGKLAILLAVLIAGSMFVILDRDRLGWLFGAAGSTNTIAGKDAGKAGPIGAATKTGRELAQQITGGGKAASAPKLDVARISSEGTSVIAGHSKPGSRVAVVADGKHVGEVKADPNGDWVLITSHKFASAKPNITVMAATGKSKDATRVASAGKVQTETDRQISTLKRMIDTARQQTKKQAAEIKAEKKKVARAPAARKPFRPDVAMGLGGAAARTTAKQNQSSRLASAGVPRHSKQAAGLPVPIEFVYREAQFTAKGRNAASLLLEYLKAKRLDAVTLSGHADEVGSHDYNMELSRQRLDVVKKFLRSGGYTGRLTLLAKGEMEPYRGVDRRAYPIHLLRQLDRRVELRVK